MLRPNRLWQSGSYPMPYGLEKCCVFRATRRSAELTSHSAAMTSWGRRPRCRWIRPSLVHRRKPRASRRSPIPPLAPLPTRRAVRYTQPVAVRVRTRNDRCAATADRRAQCSAYSWRPQEQNPWQISPHYAAIARVPESHCKSPRGRRGRVAIALCHNLLRSSVCTWRVISHICGESRQSAGPTHSWCAIVSVRGAGGSNSFTGSGRIVECSLNYSCALFNGGKWLCVQQRRWGVSGVWQLHWESERR